jgi:hypothetical protein
MPRRREPKGRQRTHAHAGVAMEGWGRAPVPQGSRSLLSDMSDSADISTIQHHSDSAHTRRRTQNRSDIRESGMGACGTVSAHTRAHTTAVGAAFGNLSPRIAFVIAIWADFPEVPTEVRILCQTHSMDVSGWRRAVQLVSTSVPCVLGARPPRPRGPHRCVFNHPYSYFLSYEQP